MTKIRNIALAAAFAFGALATTGAQASDGDLNVSLDGHASPYRGGGHTEWSINAKPGFELDDNGRYSRFVRESADPASFATAAGSEAEAKKVWDVIY